MILSIDAAKKKDPSEWFGFWSIETGEWDFYDTKFSSAVKTPGSLIIINNFSQISGHVLPQLISLFERKVCVCPPNQYQWYEFPLMRYDDPRRPSSYKWAYGCSKGVKFWLMGIQNVDIAIMQKIRWNSLIEHAE